MPTSAFNAAWAAYQGGQHLQALDACQRILASAPDDTEALHLIALIAQALGQQAMALDFLQRALTLCPQDPHLWNSLGNLARNEGRLQDAQQAYQTAIDRQKRYAVGWINLGATYKDLGRGPEAIACFQKAARLEPANSALYSHWGNALLSQETSRQRSRGIARRWRSTRKTRKPLSIWAMRFSSAARVSAPLTPIIRPSP